MRHYLAKIDDSNNALFDNSIEDFFRPICATELFNDMKTDIKETESDYQMEIEMPGFNKADINISLEKEYLTVEAKRAEKNEENEKNRFIKKERNYTMKRSYYVGDFKEEDVKAKYDNGILTLSLLKKLPEKEEAKKIAIE